MASIYNSSEVSKKADIAIENPFQSYRHFESGEPLAGGFLYVGLVGRDGEVEFNRKRVYAIMENGSAVAIPQPVILSAGGVAQYNGSPVQLAVDGSYSLKVKDKDGVKQYFAPKVTAKSLLGYSGIIPEEVKNKNGIRLSFDVIEASTATFYIADGRPAGTSFNGVIMQKDVDYEVIDESTIQFKSVYANDSAVMGRMLDPTGQTVKASVGTVELSIFNTQAEAVAANLDVGSSVIINGKDSSGDGEGGSYLVVETTEAPDGYNYINLANGNQLKIKKTYQALQGIYETVGGVTLNTDTFLIDAAEGSIFNLDVSTNIAGIDIVNLPSSGEIKIELKVTQDTTAAKTFAWLINGEIPKAAGGVVPTISTELGAVDRYVILTDDGGLSFEIYTAGQDIK